MRLSYICEIAIAHKRKGSKKKAGFIIAKKINRPLQENNLKKGDNTLRWL